MGLAVVEGFAGFTNTKGVSSSRNAPHPHGARPSLGHNIQCRLETAKDPVMSLEPLGAAELAVEVVTAMDVSQAW